MGADSEDVVNKSLSDPAEKKVKKEEKPIPSPSVGKDHVPYCTEKCSLYKKTEKSAACVMGSNTVSFDDVRNVCVRAISDLFAKKKERDEEEEMLVAKISELGIEFEKEKERNKKIGEEYKFVVQDGLKVRGEIERLKREVASRDEKIASLTYDLSKIAEEKGKLWSELKDVGEFRTEKKLHEEALEKVLKKNVELERELDSLKRAFSTLVKRSMGTHPTPTEDSTEMTAENKPENPVVADPGQQQEQQSVEG